MGTWLLLHGAHSQHVLWPRSSSWSPANEALPNKVNFYSDSTAFCWASCRCFLLCEPDRLAEAALHAVRPCQKRAADGLTELVYKRPSTLSVSLHPHTGSSNGWGWSGIKLFTFRDDYRFSPLSESFGASQKTFPAKASEA